MPTQVSLTDFTTLAAAAAPAAGGAIGSSGYVDLLGNSFLISGGVLVDNSVNTDFAHQWAVRASASEDTLNQQSVAHLKPGTETPIVLLRVVPGARQAYGLFFDSNGNLIAHVFNGGSHAAVAGATATFAFSESAEYILTAAATGENPTTLTASVALASAPGTPLASFSATDSTPYLQAAGGWGVAGTNNWTGIYSIADTDVTAGPVVTIVVTPATATAGVPVGVTLTGTNSAWTNSTTPRVASGGSNAYLTNLAYVSATELTATLNPGTAAGTVTLGDSADAATAAVTVSVSPSVNVVWIGDSLTNGINGSGTGTTLAPRLATVLAGLGPVATGTNCGIPGETLAQMVAALNVAYNGNDALNSYFDPTKAYNVAVLSGGHNDFYHGESVQQVVANVQALVSGLLAVHPTWLPVWTTELPAAFPGYPANFDALRDQVNAYVRLHWQSMGFVAISDVAGDVRVGLDGCEYNGAYYSTSDFTHMTNDGYALWGQYDLAAVQQAVRGPAAKPAAAAASYVLTVDPNQASAGTAWPAGYTARVGVGFRDAAGKATTAPAGFTLTVPPVLGLSYDGGTAGAPATATVAADGSVGFFVRAAAAGTYVVATTNDAGLTDPVQTGGTTFNADGTLDFVVVASNGTTPPPGVSLTWVAPATTGGSGSSDSAVLDRINRSSFFNYLQAAAVVDARDVADVMDLLG